MYGDSHISTNLEQLLGRQCACCLEHCAHSCLTSISAGLASRCRNSIASHALRHVAVSGPPENAKHLPFRLLLMALGYYFTYLWGPGCSAAVARFELQDADQLEMAVGFYFQTRKQAVLI